MDHYFTVVDYLVFASVLLVSAAVGVYYAIRNSKKTKSADYLVGDHRLPLIPVALSLLVSFQSAILILGASSEVYLRGTTYWWSFVGIALSALLTCYIFVPIFYYLKLTSVYEYLELRFDSKALRLIGSSLYLLVTILYMSLAIYAPSVSLYAVTRIPLWLLILSSGLICTFYVTVGGIKAVIWTDAIQAGFMFAGLLVVAIKGTLEAGGFSEVIRISRRDGRLIYFEPSLDPFIYMSSWGIIVGQLFSWFGWYGINQSSVQRYCGMRTPQQGRFALLLNIPGLFIAISLVCYCGLVMYASFSSCDPLASNQIKSSDELMPYFVMTMLGGLPGIPGLFVACLYSGTLSTVSSGLNSMAVVVWEDFGKRFNVCDEKKATLFVKCLCVFFGTIATTLAFAGPYLGGILQACVSALGAVNGPLTGLFLVGVFLPWVNKKGAIAGALLSTAFLMWLCVGSQITKPHSTTLVTSVEGCGSNYSGSTQSAIVNYSTVCESSGIIKMYSLSYVLYDMIGVLLVLMIAVPVSLCTGWQDLNKLDEKMFHPIVRRFFPLKTVQYEQDEFCDNFQSPSNEILLKAGDDFNFDRDQNCDQSAPESPSKLKR